MNTNTVTDIGRSIEARFRPVLEQMAVHISTRFPLVKTFVSSFTNNTETTHVLGLECLFTNVQASDADLLALCIDTEGAEDPRIQADVSWGDPSGYIEAELFESPRPISPETFEAVEQGLPALFEVLQHSVERGAPTEPN